jgi:hypothetical protein
MFRVGPIKVGRTALIGFVPGLGDIYALGAGGICCTWRTGPARRAR